MIPPPNRRWYRLTPARFFVGLLVVEVFLLLSERFQWFAFNEHKGWTVLIAVGVAGAAVLVMLLWGFVCLIFRWRLQFSVRSLLVFLVVVSVPMGWFAWNMRKARRQREAVEAIVGMGGGVAYEYQYDENGRQIEDAELTTPPWLRNLLGDGVFYDVVRVDCGSTEFGDNDMRHLHELPNLKALDIESTHITDKGLTRLEGNTELTFLGLDSTQITDNGLAHLQKMTKLKALSLCRMQITDDGLAHLQELTNLEELWLGRNPQITDDGLVHLEGLTNLERLMLSNVRVFRSVSNPGRLGTPIDPQVTDEGVKRLQQSLPNCYIRR